MYFLFLPAFLLLLFTAPDCPTFSLPAKSTLKRSQTDVSHQTTNFVKMHAWASQYTAIYFGYKTVSWHRKSFAFLIEAACPFCQWSFLWLFLRGSKCASETQSANNKSAF